MSDGLMPDPSPAPHRRRPRYPGRNPRRFDEKYKEHDPQRFPETAAKVLASGKTPAGSHRPIMVTEILEVLAPEPGDLAVDCTLGHGGHAQEILARIRPGGHLLALDADPIEMPKTEARLRALGFGADSFTAHRSNFAGLPQVLAAHFSTLAPSDSESAGVRIPRTKTSRLKPLNLPLTRPSGTLSPSEGERDGVRGALDAPANERFMVSGAGIILADLGVSSMQIDDPARGFSVKLEGPLDMRMNPHRGQPASVLLEKISAAELAGLLVKNADEPSATALATALAGKSFATTTALAHAVREALPRMGREDSELTIRRVFQTLRIAVNDELGALDTLLRILPSCLRPGGRVAILTFHSGEDRRVKKAFEAGLRAGHYSDIAREVIRPTPAECGANPRSGPAKLRWARRSA